MKSVPSELHLGHLFVRHLHFRRVGARIELGRDPQAALRGRGADQLHNHFVATKGRPRQFMLMWENKRCSILFHLLVPGGR